MKYQVVVGNVGTVYDGDDIAQATSDYEDYVEFSKHDAGRASKETVTLFADAEPIEEYHPNAVIIYHCPDCSHDMNDIGGKMYQCPECDYETDKNELDKILLFWVAEKCQEALKLVDLSDTVHHELKTDLYKILRIARI